MLFMAGALFAVGLALSGMTQPAKVIGFLDVAGRWDPSLAFVMVGAIAVYLVAWRVSLRRTAALFGEPLPAAPSTTIDSRLIAGALLFGVGWGISGFCPGPALVSLGAGTRSALWFVPAMIVGTVLARLWARDAGRQARSKSSTSASRSPMPAMSTRAS